MRHRLALLLALLGCDDDAAEPPDASAVEAGPLVDPLSMPASPTLDVASFSGAAVCADCHPDHFAQWRTSMHAYAMIDPVFRALVAARQADLHTREDRFCTQCHSSIGTRAGECAPAFDFEALSPVVLEGVTCEACHKVAALIRPFNSGHQLDPDGPMRGPIEDPVESSFHASQYSPLHERAEFCGGCHDVVESSGLTLERPFGEWTDSPAAAAGRTCQTCHMPASRGIAAAGGPERAVHSHRFVGVDLPLSEGFLPDEAARDVLREEVRALLATAAHLELSAPEAVPAGAQLDVVVTIRNRIDAHDLPTGSTFNRQLWLELRAHDAAGALLYATGDLDELGDLRDHFSATDPYGDADLIRFGSSLLDGRGEPTVFSWHAREHLTTTLPPAHARTFTLFVPTAAETPGPIRVTARLRFRSHAPFLLRILGLGGLLGRLEIHDLEAAEAVVDVTR